MTSRHSSAHPSAPLSHLRDQAKAAVRDAQNLADRVGDALHAEGHARPSPAVAAVIHAVAIVAGNRGTCDHLIRTPVQPWITTAWMAGLATCGRCAPQALRVPEGETYRCDVCSRIDPTTEPSLSTVGSIVVMLGSCETCRTSGWEPGT